MERSRILPIDTEFKGKRSRQILWIRVCSDQRGVFLLSHFDLALRRADYYSDGQRYQGCILVKNGKIVEIVAPDAAVDAEQVIDVAGLVVLPGRIDTHTHFRQPELVRIKNIYYSGTRAAAAAGFTTICEMPTASPPWIHRRYWNSVIS